MSDQDTKPVEGSVLAEIDNTIARLSGLAVVPDVKAELLNNTYPLMRMMADMIGGFLGLLDQRLSIAEVSIAELATMGDSVVLPDLAAQIDDVLSIGLQLCAALVDNEGELVPTETLDQEAREGLKTVVSRYRNAVNALRQELDSVTVPEDDDEGEGDE